MVAQLPNAEIKKDTGRIMKLTKLHRPLIALISMTSATLAMNAHYSTNQFANSSVLKSGHWVKIKVTENGIHQFTDEQLKEMGFSNPSEVRVYGYGGNALDTREFKLPQVQATTHSSYSDDLPQILSMYNNGRLLFYGESAAKADMTREAYRLDNVSINHYSDGGYYFLTDSQKPITFATISTRSNVSGYTLHSSHYVTQLLELNDENPTEGGVFYFSPSLISNPNQTFTFDISEPIESSTAYFGYKCVGKSTSSKATFEVQLPDGLISTGLYQEGTCPRVTSTSDYYSDANGYQHFTIPAKEELKSSYSFKINPIAPAPSYAAIDWTFLAYKRANLLGDKSQMRMVFPNISNESYIQLDDTKETIAVWDVTIPYYVRKFRTTTIDGKTTFFPSTDYTHSDNPTAMHAIAFDYENGSFPTPQVIGDVPNQSLHSMTAPDMLIITNQTCREQAERLAQAHAQYQNFDVKIVTQEEIFNEFSSGTPNPIAIRYFAKMLWDRNPSKFRHMMFFGAGHYDNIGYTHKGKDLLITYQTDSYGNSASVSTNFCADTYFGMLEKNAFDPEAPAQFPQDCNLNVAVGRIPAGNKLDATSAVDKIIKYLSNPPSQPFFNRALLLSDDEDTNSNRHLDQSEEIEETIKGVSPAATVTKAYRSLYPLTNGRAEITHDVAIRALKQGQAYVSFAGHGKPDGLAEDLWYKRDVESTSYDQFPLWMLATCDTYSFDHLNDGIAEKMLYKADGGAIAVIASGRTVYAEPNHILSSAIANAYFTATGNETLGDVFRRGRNSSLASSIDDTRINTLCYNFAGDPALPAYGSTYQIRPMMVNDIDVLTQATAPLYPHAENYISGAIIDASGEVVTSFNGEATISIYDGPNTTTVNYVINSTTNSKDVNRDESLLNEVRVPVVDGYFTSTIVLPNPSHPNTSNRISFFAVSNDNKRAKGSYNDAIVQAYDENKAIVDNTPPVISEMYLDRETFVDGDEVNSTTTLYATIQKDDSGLDNSNDILGGGATLKLDGTKSFPYARTKAIPMADGSAKFEFQLTDLSDGRHTLTLSIGDNLSNRSSRTINFVVVNRNVTSALTCDKEAVRNEATFELQHTFAETPSGRLVIEDANGNTIFTKENCSFPYTWNLNDNNGNKVADGQYRASAILKAGLQYSNTPKLDIVVIK